MDGNDADPTDTGTVEPAVHWVLEGAVPLRHRGDGNVRVWHMSAGACPPSSLKTRPQRHR